MNQKLLLPALLLGAAALATVSCQSRIPRRDPTGEVFPRVEGETLAGEARVLPDDLAGEPALLLVGYVQKAQFDADRWILGLLQAGAQVRFLEVPTIGGLVPSLLSDTIDSGMRSGIPSEDWGGVVTVYGKGGKSIERFTGSERPRNMRVLLLDAEGRVAWFHDEGYSPRELLEVLELAAGLEDAGDGAPAGD